MATRTFASNKSSLFADGPSNLGGGNDPHMPVGGPWSGYTFRSAVQFSLDFSGMKTITSAVLRMKTSSQVHVGFSSTPDFYVQRATGSWSANSSSSSSDGGSGWGTSPTVYPGPASTTTGRSAKRAPTGENASFDTDITAIVKAWAPTSIPGGGGAANYGVLLVYQASGDVTEFQSFKDGTAGDRPSIIVTYTTDTPPTATATGPTGVVTTNRPPLTGTGSDPDGDAITAYQVEVRQGSTVVYTYTATAGAGLGSGGTSYYFTATADLPSGALTSHARAQAAGVWGAYSADVPFTVDRPPTCATPTAPVGNVGGTLRPNIVFTGADPDGDPLEVYDVEVYQSTAGTPTGSAVYAATSQAGGIAGYTVTHTPTANLPSGSCAARARVRTRGVWSAWSGYSAFVVVTANPSVTWLWPPTPGGPLLMIAQHIAPGASIGTSTLRHQADVQPPSGATITRLHRKVVRLDGPGAPSTIQDSDWAGFVSGVASSPFALNSGGFAGMACTYEITWDAYSSNGGVTSTTRRGRAVFGEWQGAVYLGDNVTALGVTETPTRFPNGAAPTIGTDMQTTWYRAQVNRWSPNGAAPWRLGDLPTVLAELPAQGAYLGIYTRTYLNEPDSDLLAGAGSMEDITLPGWRVPTADVKSIAYAGAPDGSRVVRITGNGGNWPSLTSLDIPVVPGGVYVLGGYAHRQSGTFAARYRLDTFDVNGAALNRSYSTVFNNSGWLLQYTSPVQLSPDTYFARVLCFIDNSAVDATNIWDFDAVTLVGPPGSIGYDRLDVSWSSAG
jgi:hypothetical protein